MGFPRGRGGGRRGPASRGRGSHQRQHGSAGPRLPSMLMEQLEAQDGSQVLVPGSHSRGGGGIGGLARRKQQRKLERRDKKAARAAQQFSHAMQKRKSDAGHQVAHPGAVLAPAAKRARPDRANDLKNTAATAHGSKHAHPSAPPKAQAPQDTKRQAGRTNAKTRFEELLGPEHTSHAHSARSHIANNAGAYLADLRAGREAEKKLGIKKGGVLKGPSDGLGALLSGLSAASGDLLPGYLSREAAAQARSLLRNKGGADQPLPGTGLASDSDDELGLRVLQAEPHGSAHSGSEGDSEGEGATQGMGLSDEYTDTGSDEDEAASDDNAGEEAEEGEEDEGSLGATSDDEPGSTHGMADEGEEEDEEEGDSELNGSDADLSETDADEDDEVGGGAHDALRTVPATGRYVPPALRTAARDGAGDAPDATLERRVTGLLNRLADSNLAAIARDLMDLYGSHRRGAVVAAIVRNLLAAAVHGPRATPAFAATAAALIAGLAGSAGAPELCAAFLEGLAQQLEAAGKSDDSLAAHNLVLLLAACHAAGAVGSDVLYSLLTTLVARFTEADVQLMVTLLSARGLALRSSDPAAMKSFVLSVSARVAEVTRAGAGGSVGDAGGGLSIRARLMLELVIDIKNNRPAKAAGGGKAGSLRADGRAAGASAQLGAGAQGWLKTCGVDRVVLRGISWDKLLVPNKKGMWWVPEAGEALLAGAGTALPGRGAALIAELEGGGEATRLMALAAGQRMNTDARRAVFVAVMGAADVVDAHDRLLRLPLKGQQQREVVRVVVDCCLHEATYNPFYALVVARLSVHSKAHRLTAQFCMWDQYKALGELPPAQLSNLAHFNATLIARDALPLTTLKVVDFGAVLQARPLFFWRLFFQHLLAALPGPQQVKDMFERLALAAATPSLMHASAGDEGGGGGVKALRSGMLLFLRTRVGPWLSEQNGATKVSKVTVDDVLVRLQVAEAALQIAGGA